MALLIVGGGPAAHAAAAGYRSADGGGRVVIVSKDSRPPYNRPPLSKDFLRGESSEEELPLEDAGYYDANGIELVLSTEVVGLDPERRTATTDSGRTFRYHQCVLATGCAPAELDVPGADSALRLRWLDQAQTLRTAAEQASSAIVIGSGFIGCEAAASLAARGVSVTLVSDEDRPQLTRLGSDAADLIAGWLADAGVVVRGGAAVSEIRDGRSVQLAGGEVVDADLVLSAVGVTPESGLAARAGVRVRDGRIVVDEHMRTEVDGLLAAGDVVLAYNTVAARHLTVEHWGEADRMGSIAGTTAAGGEDAWSEPPGFWSEIGEHTLKYAAWGDGFERALPVHHDGGGLTVWYSTQGVVVGVLTSEADDDYERGADLVRGGAPVAPLVAAAD